MEIVWGDGHLVQMLNWSRESGGKTILRILANTSNPQVLFRYMILQLDSSGDTAQFSALQFVSSTDAIYRYPENMSVMCSANIFFFNGEGFSKALISDSPSSSMGKACFRTSSGQAFPKFFMIDTKDSPIDIKKYSMWHWYTSNDTASEPSRNMRSFKMYGANSFSDFNDKSAWTLLDEVTDYSAPTSNFTKAYSGKLTISKRQG